jgi:hypothetical protein
MGDSSVLLFAPWSYAPILLLLLLLLLWLLSCSRVVLVAVPVST